MESGNIINNFTYTVDIQKSAVGEELFIYGVASTGKEDRDGETVSMESLEKAFQKYMQRNPVLMYNHNGKMDAVGKVVPEHVGEDGTVYKSGVINNELRIVGLISRASSATDVRTQINEGILKSLSIGGRARKIAKSNKRCLLVSELHEISLVPIPANGDAMFDVIKSVCMGDNCPIRKSMETTIMDEVEMVTLIKAGSAPEAGVTPEVDVIKALTDQVEALKDELKGMKTTPIQKGIQDGEEPVEKGATDIASIIMARHYGGA